MASLETSIIFGGESFTATSDGVLLHAASGNLFVSDCHFGKTTHFRKNALPIPEQAMKKDFMRLEDVVKRLNPNRIVFLGDLFHSRENREWDMLSEFLYTRINRPLTLVLGNHDILNKQAYERAGMTLAHEFILGKIHFVHEHANDKQHSAFVVSGHIHPGYHLKGAGKQQLLLPCFYFGKHHAIMPAFGSLTGLSEVEKIHKADKVYCFTPDKIFVVD
jgi:DNA ligase-associated metallophosphoesterase